jgi:Protein of unknown function (DUF2845)
MPQHTRLALVALVACVMFNATAHADDTLRCGSRLVSTGDTKDKVRTLCGEPTSVNFAGTLRQGGYGYGAYDYSYFGPAWIDVPIEWWTYNFGSSKLLRKLRFIGDELVEIRTDGYGY